MSTTLKHAHPTRSDLRAPAAVIVAAVTAAVMAPFVEPGPTPSGVVQALGVGGVMAGVVAAVLYLLRDDTSIRRAARERGEVAAVINTRSLHAVAQPIIDFIDGRVVGVEMLARFDVDPAAPQAWFARAAAVGRLQDLELLAVDVALHTACDLPERLFVSINVSPNTLCTRELRTAIAAGPIKPRRIILELTEHDQIDDYNTLRAALVPLRAMGVRLAVDDAGAGYSSFRHILNLKPNAIKVDRALISDVHADPCRRALAAAIVMFALEMNATVTAEGVEHDEELEALKLLGIDYAQGYLLGRPTSDRSVWSSWEHMRRASVLT